MINYLHTTITPDMRQQLCANVKKLPVHLRWKGKTTPQCDFCASDEPNWAYAADRLTSGQICRCWRWLACDDCRALINANDFRGLIRRSAMGFKGDKAEGVIAAVMMAFRTDAIEVKPEEQT